MADSATSPDEPEQTGNSAPSAPTTALQGDLAPEAAANESLNTENQGALATTTSPSEDAPALSPQDTLLRLRESLIETFNTEVADTFKRLMLLADGLDELQRAQLVRLDTTTCPRNTIFEHVQQKYVWFDPELDAEQSTLECERCLGGLCDTGTDVDNLLWLRKQTIWSRFQEARRLLDDLNRDRPSRLKQLDDFEEQLQTIRQSEKIGPQSGRTIQPARATLDDLSALLIDPTGLAIPVVQEPVELKATATRTSEDLQRERKRLIEAIEAGSYDTQLGVNAKGSTDCRSLLPNELHSDAEVWKAMLRRYPDQMKYLPRTTLATPQFALQMLDSGGALAQRVSESLPETLRGDNGFVLKLIEQNWRAARDSSGPEVRNSPDVALKALRHFDQDVIETLNWIGPVARDNAFVMSTATLMCPTAIKFASDRLKHDHEFVHDVLQASLVLCEEATRRERTKSRFAGAANFDWRVTRRENSRYRIGGRKDAWHAVEAILEHLPDEPRNDEGVMLLALLHDGRAMEYASNRLRLSRTFVLSAITAMAEQQYPEHLQDSLAAMCPLIDPTLRDDEEIAISAIEACSGRMVMECWSEKLLSNLDFLIRAMSLCLYRKPLLAAASATLKSDERVVMTALVTDGTAIQAAAPRLQSDKRFILKAIHAAATPENFNETLTLARHHYGDQVPAVGDNSDERLFAATQCQISLGDLAESLRGDRDIAIANLEIGGIAKGTSVALLNDTKFAADAISVFARKAAFSNMRHRIGDRLMAFLPDRVRDNEDVILTAIKEQGGLARFASARLRSDARFAARAVAVSENAAATIEHLSKALRDNHDVMEATAKVNADLAVQLASDRLKNDELFAATVLKSAVNPERLRSKLAKPAAQVTQLSSSPGSGGGMTAADWWAVVVVVLGALLFGYIFVAVPKFEEFASGTTMLQVSIAVALGLGVLFALNQVRVSRRSHSMSPEPPTSFVTFDDSESQRYTRDGGLTADFGHGDRRAEGGSADITQ